MEFSCKRSTDFREAGKCSLCALFDPPGCAVCANKKRLYYSLVSEYMKHKMEAEKLEKEIIEKDPEETNTKEEEEPVPEYEKLLDLETLEFVPNTGDFTCPVCFIDVPTNEGVTLRECLHSFCRPCLVSTIKFCGDAEVKCPYRDDEYTCDCTIQDREIRALIPLDLQEQMLARSIDLAEKRMGSEAFHCKTPDCKGWCVIENYTNEFLCPVCGRKNCLDCQAIHGGIDCTAYQENLRLVSQGNLDQKNTKETLQIMMNEGKAVKCPSCGAVIMKDTGCDWLCSSMCKMELCWITRGPRWGPKGNGDISGGCKCKVNGVKCHPMCNNCH